MTLTLTASIDADIRYLEVTGTVTVEPGYRFRIGDELLELQGFVQPYATVHVDPNQWYVRRGLDLSTAASHTAGDEILGAADAFVAATSGTTPPDPFAGGGSDTPDLDAVLAESTGQNIADALTHASAPDAGNVFATLADVGGSPAFGQGLTFAWPVILADCQAMFVGTNDVPLPSYTYLNDDSPDGVGSTMTADENGAFVPDGSYPAQVGDRIGVADGVNAFFGIFTVTDLGADDPDGSPWVLTRATDADTVETFCRQWAVRSTGGDTFDGGMLRSYSIEDPLNPPDVDSFSQSGRFMVQTSTGGYAGGVGAMAVGTDSLALGTGAVAGTFSSALGYGSVATEGGIAIGGTASAAGATAIGSGAVASAAGVTVIDGSNGVKVILMAPNESRWYLVVANDGTVSAVAV